MSEPGDSDGWAPLDPDLSGDRRPDPPAEQARPPHGAARSGSHGEDHGQGLYGPGPYGQEHGQGLYGPGQYGQSPYGQSPYGQSPYGQSPYGQAPYGQAPYGQSPYGQSPYGQGPYPGPYAYPAQYGAPPVKRAWSAPPPPRSPFHRMARTEVHRWWRPLLGTLTIVATGVALASGLLLAGMIVAVAVTGEVPDEDQTTIFGNVTADLAFNLAALGLFLPVTMLVAWGIQRRRPGTLSSVAGRLRWKWMLACCGLAIGFCVVAFGASLLAGMSMGDRAGEAGDQYWVGWEAFLVPALVIVLLVPFQAAAEEYVFRGWILQAVGACTLENVRNKAGRALSVVFRTPWPGILIGSALFTSGHGYTSWGILDIFVFGVVAGWVTVRTGGLEAAIALHVFNNLMAFLGAAAIGELDLEQGAIPWQVVVADVVPMLLFAAAAVWVARKMRVQTRTPAPDEAPSTGDARPAYTP